MPTKDIEALEKRLARIPGVSAVLGAADVISPSIPVDILPDAIRNQLFVNGSTLLIVKHSGSGMSDETQRAIRAIREESGKQCFVSGASVVLKDTKDLVDRETPIYVLLAVALSVVVLSLTMESFLIPFIFLVEIGLAILYNFGTNFVFGQISCITKALAAVLQLGVTMDYAILLTTRYREELRSGIGRIEAMRTAVHTSARSIISMLVILFIIPAIFVWGEKLIAKTTLNWDHPPRGRSPKGRKE